VCSSCGSLVLYLDKQAKNKKIIRMKKIRKSTGVALAFLIYVSVTAAYLLPRNTEVSLTEKIITVVVSYVIVLLLWLVLRKKEQMRERRKKDEQSIHLKK
jgi:Ca2+/Na+ antiporter